MGLKEDFSLDNVALSEHYLKLQRRFHPDRFVDGSAQEQRLAVQMASVVNQACDTLRSPLLRAAYLLKLQGIDSSGENTTMSDVTFLMSQMQLREQLAAITSAEDPFVALELVAVEVASQLADLEALFAEQYGEKAFTAGSDTLVKMQFYNKLQLEVNALEDSLEDV